jgi:hypothetical protein
MEWWRLKFAVLAIVVLPITYCLAMQAAFTILNAIFSFVLGFTLAIGLAAGCVALVILPEER